MVDSRNRPKVLVVGGSFAGLAAVRKLQKSTEVTLCEPKEYFEYSPGILHILTGSPSANTILSPLSQCAEKSKVVNGYFKGVNPTKKVALIQHTNGDFEEILYDFLIIATGRGYAAPIRPLSAMPYGSSLNIPDRMEEIKLFRQRMQEKKKIVVTGGGLVGVELAAELVSRLQHQPEVYLLSRSSLLSSLPSTAGRLAYEWLTQNGVKVILGKDEILHTKKIIENDGDDSMFIDCTGSTHSSAVSAIESSTAIYPHYRTSDEFISPYSNEGYVIVDTYLRHTTLCDVYAAGDVVQHKKPVKAAYTCARHPYAAPETAPSLRNANLAEMQAELVAEAIKRAGASPPTHSSISPLSTVSPHNSSSSTRKNVINDREYPMAAFGGARYTPALACVSLGPLAGIVVFNNLVIGGKLFSGLAAFIKYFIERSKISEIRNQCLGIWTWQIGHIIVNFFHRLLCVFQNILFLFRILHIRIQKVARSVLS